MGVFGLLQLWALHDVAVKVTGGDSMTVAAGIGAVAITGAAIAIPVVNAVTGIELFNEVFITSFIFLFSIFLGH